MKFTKIILVSVILVSSLAACGNSDEVAPVAEPQVANEVAAAVEGASEDPDVDKSEGAPQQGQGGGGNRPQNFDYDSIAAELGVTAEDLQAAVEANQSQGFMNFSEIAAQLNIDEAALAEAFKTIDGGLGGGRGGNFDLQNIDFATAAETLNISEEDLRAAVENNQPENGPIDYEQIALELGITADDLIAALGIHGPGMGGKGNPNN